MGWVVGADGQLVDSTVTAICCDAAKSAWMDRMTFPSG